MMALRTDDEIRHALSPFIDDVRAGLSKRIGEGAPDFQEAVARAHGADPLAVPEACVRASKHPSLLPIEPDARQESADFPEFLADVGEQVEAWSTARRLTAVPPRQSSRRWVAVAVGLGGVLAAAAALVFSGVIDPQSLMPRDDAAPPSSAEMLAPPAEERASQTRKPRARPKAPPAAVDAPEPDPEPEPEVEPVPDPVEPAARKPARSSAPSLQELDEKAETLWRSGDVRGAEKALEELVRRGGKSKYAELAFGDLFTIAHRKHRTKRQIKLWRRYLARFPKGRYADDARAGLCRHSSDASVCWERYLKDWPRGSHRAEAKRQASG